MHQTQPERSASYLRSVVAPILPKRDTFHAGTSTWATKGARESRGGLPVTRYPQARHFGALRRMHASPVHVPAGGFKR